ncbi:hypothetical protein [Oryza sativa Japonica Group]|uniref:Uncharacterized protein n=1 Tax=Oryza sativa subsp. japonica TaxID=39947 RepID=Q8LJE0_ORYSJ|nr:hypothetical protein [Oryza sativa Japonica Group]
MEEYENRRVEAEERAHVDLVDIKKVLEVRLPVVEKVGGTRATGQGRRREVGADGGAHGGTPGAAARTAARSGWRRGGGEGGGSAVCRRRGSGSCFVHILMLDLIISYGVFGQRNADFEVAAVAATKTVDDESVESFSDGGSEANAAGKEGVQAWSSLYFPDDPLIVVADVVPHASPALPLSPTPPPCLLTGHVRRPPAHPCAPLPAFASAASRPHDLRVRRRPPARPPPASSVGAGKRLDAVEWSWLRLHARAGCLDEELRRESLPTSRSSSEKGVTPWRAVRSSAWCATPPSRTVVLVHADAFPVPSRAAVPPFPFPVTVATAGNLRANPVSYAVELVRAPKGGVGAIPGVASFLIPYRFGDGPELRRRRPPSATKRARGRRREMR